MATAPPKTDITPEYLKRLKLGDMAELYRDLWDRQAELDQQSKDIGSQMFRIQSAMLERMDAEDVERIDSDRITMTRKEEMFPKVGDWSEIFPWAIQNHPQLLRKQLNSGAFKELIESGEELPEGLEVTTAWKMNRRRK